VTATDNRRGARHRPAGWKVAVEFDEDGEKRLIQATIHDLSSMGAAILTNDRDLTGTAVKLSISYPGAPADQKPLRIRARVVSSAHTPGTTRYRHGLSFIRLPFDGRNELERILQAASPRGANRDEPVAAPDGAAVRRGRLAQLRMLADAKRAEAKKPDPRDESDALLSQALKVAYRYLKDLSDQLNVIRPAYAKTYVVPGVPEFARLEWEEGRADFRTRDVTPILNYYDRVSLRFRISANRELKFAKEWPENEKLKQFLEEAGVTFTAHDMFNERGATEGSKFIVTCEVKASVLLYTERDLGKVLLRASNVSGFGSLSQLIAPEAINEEALDELAGFILGEQRGPGSLLLRRA
jgi:PilZ domain-containing protein